MTGRMSGDHKRSIRRLTRDHVVWAYRLLLDRDPENEDVIGPKLAGSRDTGGAAPPPDDLGGVPGEEPRLRAHQRSDDRHQGARARRAPVRRSLRSRDRPEHRPRPLRGGRGPRSCAACSKPGDTAIDAGAHIGFFTMQMAAMVGARRTRPRVRTVRRQRGSARAIDSRERVRRSRRLPPRRGRRGLGHGDADVPGRNAEHGRRVPAARRHAAARRATRTKSVPVVALDDLHDPAAGPASSRWTSKAPSRW